MKRDTTWSMLRVPVVATAVKLEEQPARSVAMVEQWATALGEKVRDRPWLLVVSRGGERRGIVRALANVGLRPSRVVYSDTAFATSGPTADVPPLEGAPVLVAVGGGATLDRAKLLAMDLAMGSSPWREPWLASGQPPSPGRPIPQIIAVPTLAGSGAEATCFATVWTGGRKRSLEHPGLRPWQVILDPSLAATAEPGLRLVSALDGLTHALEAIWNRNATSESDVLAVRAIAQFASAFSRDEVNSGDDFPWLGEASWFAGSAIAITRTSLCHAISYPFTAELGVSHGLAVSFTVGEVAHRVASGHPERAALIGRGLGCEPDSIGRALENLISRSGARDRQASALPPDALDKLSGSLADVTRAGTFLDTVDEQVARDVAMRALARLHS